jgi:hypothetical protein
MRVIRQRLSIGIAALALLLAGAAGGEGGTPSKGGYKIVVQRESTVSAVGRRELAAIFLLVQNTWPDGTAALPVDQIADNAVREGFSREIHGRSAKAIKNYWLQVLFAGRGVPPVEKASDAEVLAFVKAHPGAVGYVSADARSDDVKVLRVDP